MVAGAGAGAEAGSGAGEGFVVPPAGAHPARTVVPKWGWPGLIVLACA